MSEPQQTAPVFRVSGTINEAVGGTAWDPCDDSGLLVNSGEGFYFCLLRNVPAGQYEFKVSQDGGWDMSWGAHGECYPGCPNISVTLTQQSHVGVTFDKITHEVLVDVVVPPPPGTPQHVRDRLAKEKRERQNTWATEQLRLRTLKLEQSRLVRHTTPKAKQHTRCIFITLHRTLLQLHHCVFCYVCLGC
eukprot:m.99603 g.99603  ORF g.99603 m.99603 type:complete len:190 (-) comp13148_c1_seq2:1232-1801(-)